MNEEMYYLSKGDINEMLLIGLVIIVWAVIGIGFCLYDIYKEKAETFKAKEVKLRDEKRKLKRELSNKAISIRRKEDEIQILKSIIKEMQRGTKKPQVIPFPQHAEEKI